MARTFRLVALDIDYTLVGADRRIAPRDLEAVRRCIEEGIEVVLATGRTRSTTLPVIEQIGRPVAAICNTGGVIYDENGRVLQRLTVPLTLAREILRRLRAADVPVRVDAGGRYYSSHEPPQWFAFLPLTVDGDIASRLDVAPDQIVVYGREATERVIKEFSYLAGDVQLLVLPNYDEPTVVHILHPRATKGAALADYCRRRGIHRNEVAAFGDSLNDFTMLSFAGFGVAVPESEPILRLVADKTMAPGETLADVLERHVLV